jgi:hypothetical protein
MAALAPGDACAEGVTCIPEAGSHCLDPDTGEILANHRSVITIG